MKKFIDDFKTFISRGNVMDMAVGVIIGSAFGKIVTSLVNDILMPLIGVILGGLDFSGLAIKVGDASIAYGSFIQTVIDFLIVAFCIFTMIKFFEKFKKKELKKSEATKPSEEVMLLREIRDSLKKKK
jgi:large conductance mechanosensitive channel